MLPVMVVRAGRGARSRGLARRGRVEKRCWCSRPSPPKGGARRLQAGQGGATFFLGRGMNHIFLFFQKEGSRQSLVGRLQGRSCVASAHLKPADELAQWPMTSGELRSRRSCNSSLHQTKGKWCSARSSRQTNAPLRISSRRNSILGTNPSGLVSAVDIMPIGACESRMYA